VAQFQFLSYQNSSGRKSQQSKGSSCASGDMGGGFDVESSDVMIIVLVLGSRDEVMMAKAMQ